VTRYVVAKTYLYVAVQAYRRSPGSGQTHWVHPDSVRRTKRAVRDFIGGPYVGGWPAARKAGWRVVYATLEVSP
jgi:hypothetical protein